MSVALRISKINSRNLGKRYRIVWTTGVKMMFPLAAHLDGISQPSLIGARFGDSVGGKSQKPVISLVWEVIRCEKREKPPSEVLYRFQNCVSPGGAHGGRSLILGMISGVSHHVDRRGKTLLKPIEYLTRWLPAFLAPNYLSNSRSYGYLKYTSHTIPKFGLNQSMLRNSH